jgi:sensor histidine kinase regulating citrate/malate metabolism
LPENSNEDQVAVLITVLGNLIENALEALGQNRVVRSAYPCIIDTAGCIAK